MAVHGDSKFLPRWPSSYQDGPMMEGDEIVWAGPSNEETLMLALLRSPRITHTTKNIYATKG